VFSHKTNGENRDRASAAVRLPLSTIGRRTKAGAKAKAVERVEGNRGALQKPQAPAFAGDADRGGGRKSKAKTQAAGQREEVQGR